ncbi:MAG: hypothetical protein EBT09_09090 [Actinobacteria bacterium]|nr:hypothetical protein [Actinomycetota bacterium]
MGDAVPRAVERKNLRSLPNRALGAWPLDHHGTQPGDEVRVSRQSDATFLFNLGWWPGNDRLTLRTWSGTFMPAWSPDR